MKKRVKSVIALCSLSLPIHAFAASPPEQTTSATIMPEMVVTATRSTEDIKTIPAKIEVIDRQMVELTTGDTITEQLKKNASIGVIEYPGTLAGIGIRGFRPEYSGITKHSVILINSRPAGATNLATILADNIERIEVLKGPASSLYGGEAMGGVVNIITRKNTEALTGTAEVGFGSFNTNYQKANIGGAINNIFDFDFSAKRYDQVDDFKMGRGETRANTSYRTQNGSLRLGINLGESWRLDFSGDLYQGRDIEQPGDVFDGDTASGSKDIDRYGIDAVISGELAANDKISFTAYQTNETTENYQNYTGWGPYTPTAPYQSRDSETDWLGFQLKNEYTWQGHRFITGIDYQDISQESRYYNQDGTKKAPWSPDEGRTNWAGYLETVWSLLDDHLTATLGGRYDNFDVETLATPLLTGFTPNSESFTAFSPRAGVNYLFDQGIRLHTTIGKAFVPPSAAQLAGNSIVWGTTYKGNPNLDPESSLTYDIGLGYDLTKLGLSVDFTYFHTDVDDKIITIDSTPTTKTYENSLSAKMEGLETMLSFDMGAPLDWQRSLTLFVNSTHMFRAEEEQTNGTIKDIQNVAKYTINYGLQYDDGDITGKLNFRTQGSMKDTDWNAPGTPEVEYPSFTIADLVTTYSLLDQHRVSLEIDNIFDKDYFEKKGYPKPGRSFQISYRYEF